MKTFLRAAILGCALLGAVQAADSENRITPEMQAALNAQKRVVAGWAANSTVVAAVKAQNKKGPAAGVTNRTWKAAPPADALVRSLQENAASKWLEKKLVASGGLYREAFLSAAGGEAAAFVQKPSLYLHGGAPKFDLPMSGQTWQGKPEWDKSSSSYAVQIAVPVVSGGKSIGVLVVGVSMKMVKALAKP